MVNKKLHDPLNEEAAIRELTTLGVCEHAQLRMFTYGACSVRPVDHMHRR
jgi:hypothetical protein